MKANRWLGLILTWAIGAAAPMLPLHAQTAGESPADIARREIEQQREILLGQGRSRQDREEAARRLVQRRAFDILLEGLRSTDNDTRYGVARALADAENLPPDFIDDLARCLPTNPQLAEAAAFALASYKENPAAQARLREFVQSVNVPERLRVAAIRPLGTLSDKETARFLVENLLRGDASPLINAAAADALIEMTGLTEYGNDLGQWDRWWQEQRTRTAEAFRTERRAERETGFRQSSQRLEQLARAISDFVFEGHRVISDEKEREAYILRCLKNPQPEFRAAGAMLVTVKKDNGETISPAIVAQLRDMIGDSSVDVRRKVSIAVKAINDPGSVGGLLAQLQRERIPSVRAALIDAIAPTKDIAAAGELMGLLQDPSFQVAEASARALASLGSEIAKNPSLARQDSNALARALERTSSLRGATRLREWLVAAMVPLRDPALVKLLFALLPEREGNTPQVRINAIRALAAVNAAPLQADIAQNVAASLHDSVKGVRLEAANALGIVGSPVQAGELYRAMDPRQETDEQVRDAAWKSLSSLFDQFEVRDLFFWGTQNFNDAPERKLVVYLALNKKLIPLGPPRAEELAVVQQEIGALYLSPRIDKPEEAVPFLQGALTYWDTKPGVRIETIQSLLMNAYLKSKKYKEAVAFAGGRITRNAQNQEPMGRAISREVDRLREANQLQAALQLLDETRNLPIQGYYKDVFIQQTNDIRGRLPSLQELLPRWWMDVVA